QRRAGRDLAVHHREEGRPARRRGMGWRAGQAAASGALSSTAARDPKERGLPARSAPFLVLVRGLYKSADRRSDVLDDSYCHTCPATGAICGRQPEQSDQRITGCADTPLPCNNGLSANRAHKKGRGCPRPRFCAIDRKSTRLNSSHVKISYAVFCLKKKKKSRHE